MMIAKKNRSTGATQTIEEHGQHALSIYNRLDKTYNLRSKLGNIIESCNKSKKWLPEHTDIMLELIKDAMAQHDIGKQNPEFQKKIRGEQHYGDSSHSQYSAWLFIRDGVNMVSELKYKTQIKRRMQAFVIALGYIISRHHSNLEDFNERLFYEGLKLNYGELLIELEDVQDVKTAFNSNFGILCRLISSLLVSCDVIASYEFESGKEYDVNTIDDVALLDIRNRFEADGIIQSIRNGNANSEINRIRSEIFLKAEESIGDERVSFLDAQTGSGKTITSLGLISKMLGRDYKRVVYTAPFKTILNQTEKVIRDILDPHCLLKNEDTEIACDPDDIDFDRDVLSDTILNANTAITSHVKLFDMLFGTKKSSVMGLWGLMDSVVVIDEVQAYTNKKWINIINMLTKYAELLNIKLIIMSATLPKLDKLLRDKVNCKYLLSDIDVARYREFFNKRVKTDFSMLNIAEEDRLDKREAIYNAIDEKIEQHSKGGARKFLIGVIKNDTSFEVWERFRAFYPEADVCIINSNVGKAMRQRIIDKINDKDNKKMVILVATQAIEAGTDISMDVGFKDYGILDSDIQFKGRINRSCEGEGFMYIFDLDDYKGIYRDDLRKRYTLAGQKGQKMFVEEEFEQLYNANFELLEREENLDVVLEQCRELQFRSMEDSMELINQNTIQVLLESPNSVAKLEEYKAIKKDRNLGFGEKKVLLKRKRLEFGDELLKLNMKAEDIVLAKDEELGVYLLDEYDNYIEESEFGDVFCANRFKLANSGFYDII